MAAWLSTDRQDLTVASLLHYCYTPTSRRRQRRQWQPGILLLAVYRPSRPNSSLTTPLLLYTRYCYTPTSRRRQQRKWQPGITLLAAFRLSSSLLLSGRWDLTVAALPHYCYTPQLAWAKQQHHSSTAVTHPSLFGKKQQHDDLVVAKQCCKVVLQSAIAKCSFTGSLPRFSNHRINNTPKVE